ncbi:DNA primase [Streptomyces sp. NPDC052079]|uniref:DNA primase n=1 Tax=Streptomyces sp. NPDC052079 TaxID=3155526 RepID=UPI00341E0D02
MNRMGLGLAIGVGYLLGRTKKLKTAAVVGGLVAGKKLNVSPRVVAELVSRQLQNNPQFKELGDQLRGDLRGVGKAASGALVERQIGSLADRLHGRTAAMREQVGGGAQESEEPEEEAGEEPEEREREPDGEAGPEQEKRGGERAEERAPERTAKKAPPTKAPAKRAAPAKKAAAKRTPPAKKTAARKTAAVSRGGPTRTSKGGGER